jgi:23S rRNA pseudouridine2605 synthase
MRLNKYIAQATGLSRRSADKAISQGRATVNGQTATLGSKVGTDDTVTLDSRRITPSVNSTTIMLNKPPGYVVSRDGQGSQTVYDLLPHEYQHLKPVGRLDKESSGLLLLTDDGDLSNQLTHPRYTKLKIYEISLDRPLEPLHQQMINDHGLQLEDGLSRLSLQKKDETGCIWQVTMSEGRNRQIRRTFAALNYKVMSLHRIQFGDYKLSQLVSGEFKIETS